MGSEVLFKRSGAYECDLSGSPSGWVMATVCLEDVDGRFIRNMDHDREWENAKVLLHDSVTYEDWNKAFVSLRACLELVESRAGEISVKHSASAEQFSGVATCGQAGIAAIWTALDGGRWTVNLYQGESGARVISASDHVTLGPSISVDGNGKLWCGWVTHEVSGDTIHIADESGRERFNFSGRYPSLVAVGGSIAVCFERLVGRESHIYFSRLTGDSLGKPMRLSSRNPLNFLPRCITDGEGQLLVAWESLPSWGFDVRVDLSREVELKHVEPVRGRITDGPGTEDGVLPIPARSFLPGAGRWSSDAPSNPDALYPEGINMTPSNPRILRIGEDLICTFRMFEPDLREIGKPWIVDGGLNPDVVRIPLREGWYLCSMRWNGQSWSSPQRVSETVGFSYPPYGIAGHRGNLIIAGHCYNPAQMPPRDHRVEVLSVGGGLPEMHHGLETFVSVPLPDINPPTQAPVLPNGPDGMRLVFGDLHQHSSHSSCFPAVDGSAPDNIRLQRDFLGHEVLCIADHHRISDVDYRQRLDLLERETNTGRVPIYALEWSKLPWQHINFYSYDKEIMKNLRQILLSSIDVHLMFNEIVEKYPGKVTAMRHFHGYGIQSGDTHTYLYDPRIEWGMEVLRGRGDALATVEGMFGGLSEFPFPVNFIEWKGAKLGLIGSSDHHQTKLGACVTGFWVPELTGEAIFEALRERRTIACANGKLAMWVSSGETAIGQVGEAKLPVEINVSVASPLPVERASLWTNGKWVQHRTVAEGEVDFSFTEHEACPGEHYYIVRVQTQTSTEYPKGPIIGYSSPLWLTVG